MNVIQYEKDNDNIVHLILDRPDASANIMDDHFCDSLERFMETLRGESSVAGVIMRSNKKTFFAGGDLDSLILVTEETGEHLFDVSQRMKASMRELETMGIPVVAAIDGAALGGGWEMALACHHRVVLNNKSIQLGLPEVTLGLLPGGGGIIRMVRLLGLQGAFPYIIEGKQFKPAQGVKAGLVHELSDTPEDTIEKAKVWIKANPQVKQPWDEEGYKMPGGTPSDPQVSGMLPIIPAILKNQTKGCMPAPEAILCTAVEGAQLDFETATRIESRNFVTLACGQVAKNMIGTFWHQLNAIKAGGGRPDGYETTSVKKLGVLGAGMMGAGIAYAAAAKGIEVVLKDISVEAAEKGKSYSAKLLEKRVSRGRMTEEKRDQFLARIISTEKAEDLQGCDLVIEAVFEDRNLKATVTQEAEAQLGDDAIFASNTSTLPITGLAKASKAAEKFIGLHFFSPVDKMPLVEIICGEQTDDETLARAYDFVLQIAKTPIVVNDSPGFFTSRVFGMFTQEGVAMLGEGIAPPSIENGSLLAGFPVGPLAISDEVTLTLMSKIRAQAIADLQAAGESYVSHPADAIVDSMLEEERPSKAAGKGFYEYPQGSKKYLWEGLQKFYNKDAQIPLQDIKDRLLFIQAVETVRCVDEGVLRSVRDANIGSIFGIGYPPWTGGILQFINQYGLRDFVLRAQELASKYGDRFEPPQLLIDKAERGEIFSD